jgi:hypothetical protein
VNERPVIHLGDLARALARLEVTDARTGAAVTAALGLKPPAALAGPADQARRAGRRARPTRRPAPEPARPPAEPVRKQAEERREATIPSTVSGIWSREPTPPPRQVGVGALDRPSADPAVPVDPEPLLVPRWARGIVSAALATPDGGPVDVERTIDLVARLEPLRRVPALPRPTLRHGAQVLLDRSEAMLPFYRDQAVLVRTLAEVVGRHRLEVLRFAGCPASSGAGPDTPFSWEPYRPPRPGVPVVLVSDLGANEAPLDADAATPDDWREFASAVEAAGCPLLAFVPAAHDRLPEGLPRSLRVIVWDRTTTARDARHAAAGAGGRSA